MKMLSISAMLKTFSTFNRFTDNSLVIQCTLVFDKYEHNVQALMNTNVIEFAFIDEKIAQLICEKLQINLVILSWLKHVNEFDDRLTKFIIHVIYSTLIVQNHSELSILMFITKIDSHSLILDKSWMNTHEVMLNMQTNKIIFKTDRCIHSEAFNSLRASDKRRSLSRNIYLSFSTSFEKFSVSISSQKYKILQRRSSSMIAKIRSSRSTIENCKDEEKLSLKIVLNHNFRYIIEEIDKKYSSIRLFKKKRRVKIIRDFQQSTLIETSIRRFDLIKKSTRRSFRSSKSHVIENDDMKFDIEKSMNIIFIEVVAFQFLANIKSKKKNQNIISQYEAVERDHWQSSWNFK